MKTKVFLGIDTSNYTTSLSFCDLEGNILDNYKILLPVKEGERGLRQSDAVFAHLKNFEIITEKIKEKHADYEILAIGCSKYPRDVKGSYMPCFLVGEAICRVISSIYKLDLFEFSHQNGHIMAAIHSSGAEINDDFIAFHVSGGTTEILHVTPENDGFLVELIGGSSDLHAGQAIDRIGVKMGLKFPCGREIERLAMMNRRMIPPFKVSVNGLYCNLSGVENLAVNLLNETNNIHLVSAFVLSFIEKTIIKLTENVRTKYPGKKIIFAGGVMSNQIIKQALSDCFDNVYFAKPEFSSDNACGTALLTRKKYLK